MGLKGKSAGGCVIGHPYLTSADQEKELGKRRRTDTIQNLNHKQGQLKIEGHYFYDSFSTLAMAMLKLAPKLQHELQAALEQQPWLTTITRSAAITNETKTETEI